MEGSSARGVPTAGYVGSMEAQEFEDWMESTFQKHHKSVIRIVIKEGNKAVRTSTGFVVFTEKERSLVMTCHHNFEHFNPEEEKAMIRLSGRNDELPLVIEHFDSIHGLLLFSVTGMSCPPLELSEDDVASGSRVTLLGYCSPNLDLRVKGTRKREMALVKDPSVMPGNILGEPYTTSDINEFHEVITYNCPATPGTLGGPVIINGKVIGVHTAATKNFREAVSVKTVKFVMEKWLGLPHDGKYTTNEMLEELAAKITEKGKQKGV